MLFGCEEDGEGIVEGFRDLIGEGGMFQSQCICEENKFIASMCWIACFETRAEGEEKEQKSKALTPNQ